MTFEIIIHYPKSPEKMKELERRAGELHALTVSQYIERLHCPKEQKLILYNEIKKIKKRNYPASS